VLVVYMRIRSSSCKKSPRAFIFFSFFGPFFGAPFYFLGSAFFFIC
jgi:hypothetical protein